MKRFSAQYIITATGSILKRGIITTDDDGLILNIEDTGGKLPERSSTEFYNGIIVPGFVNCHSHLELSDMKGVINRGRGLASFIREVSENRNPHEAGATKSIKEADAFLFSTGTSAVADICNTSLSFETKDLSKIKYINFLEVFGADPQKSAKRIEAIKTLMLEASKHKSPSYYVPHSAYSVSTPLFEELKSLINSSKLTSIHFLESEQERMLIDDLSGPMMESFSMMGITPEMIRNRVRGHLDAIKKYIPEETTLLLVHNTFIREAEIIELTKRPDTWWCLCPKSNLYIEDSLPPVELLLSNGANIVLGTDSLASTDSLNLLDDLILLQVEFPELSLNQLIEWSSANGAKALNMSSLGIIEKGKTPGLVLIENCDLKKIKLTPQSKSRRLI